MSRRRMTSTTVYLPDDELTELRTAARFRRVAMAELIRSGIRLQLAEERARPDGPHQPVTFADEQEAPWPSQ